MPRARTALVLALLCSSFLAAPATAGDNICDAHTSKDQKCVGTEHADSMVTAGGNDHLAGKGGDDRLDSKGGSDTDVGGSGDDRIHGGKGSDELRGGGGQDIELGDETGPGGDDLVVGGKGHDRLFGMAGEDRVIGTDGDDVIHGGDGVDVMKGGPGNDTLDDAPRTHQDRDHFDGNEGNDEIFSRDGLRDTIVCGSGHDIAKADHADKVASDCEQVIRIG